MAQLSADIYPSYTMGEKVADGAVHLVGIMAAIAAISVFLALNVTMLGAGQVAGLTIYWVGLLAMLTVSFCYHMTPWEALRPGLRRVDHAAIFLKIAGTYTPLVIAVGTAFSYVILGVVWGLALICAALKLFRWKSPGKFGALMYLSLGWISVFLIWSVFKTSPAAGWCAVAGGLLYSAGVVFYHWESLKFANAIWHGFVVVASGLFFAATWIATLA